MTPTETKTVPLKDLIPAHMYQQYFFFLFDNQGNMKPFKTKDEIGEFLKSKMEVKDYLFEVVNCHGEGITSIANQLFRHN